MRSFHVVRAVVSATLLGAAFSCQPGLLAADKHESAYQQSDLAKITKEVRHELLMLPYYNVFDNLAYRVDPGGVVTLMGQVTNPTLKSDAGNVVKRIEGVTSVNNQIEVLPLSPMDNQIRRAVARAIYANPALADRYGYQSMPSIHILVKNGNVELTGVVANQADKNIAGIQANGVPGVFKVVNNLQVER